MKIHFTKLKTSADNITVKYDESGNNTISYSVDDIKNNNNEIEFNGTICADLDNIEISTGNESIYKPEFNDENDYDTLFEYLNGCKTAKWVIDEEHFPYTWKKLFGPDHVISTYNVLKKGDTNNNGQLGGYLKFYESSSFIPIDLELFQILLEACPWGFENSLYKYSSSNGYEIYNSEVDEASTLYAKSPYSITYFNDDILVLNDIYISDKKYKVVERDGNSYIAIVDAMGNIYDWGFSLTSSNYNDAEFIRYHQRYYFGYVGENKGKYSIANYSNSNYYYHHFYKNKNSTSLDYDYNLIPTNEYQYGRLDIEGNPTELENFFSNTSSEFRNKEHQPVYRVYIKGYDLTDNNNIELSKKLLVMLSVLQYGWRHGNFPIISYSSFNDNTLSSENTGYGKVFINNCNSLIKLLGMRRICNLYYQTYGNNRSLIYLKDLADLDDDYMYYTPTTFIYERNIKNNDHVISQMSLSVIPSPKKLPDKTLYLDGYFYFLEGFSTPKSHYILNNKSAYNRLSDKDKELFTVASN